MDSLTKLFAFWGTGKLFQNAYYFGARKADPKVWIFEDKQPENDDYLMTRKAGKILGLFRKPESLPILYLSGTGRAA